MLLTVSNSVLYWVNPVVTAGPPPQSAMKHAACSSYHRNTGGNYKYYKSLLCLQNTRTKEVLHLTALQYRMLELVLEIDAICKKHDIVYYLAGGSVLGAVRHKGFIPWDDDIDIMMTRQAFAKFQDVCGIEMADDREIITMINTPCHTKVTIKYMNKSTSQFFRSQVLDTTGCGIWCPLHPWLFPVWYWDFPMSFSLKAASFMALWPS